MAKEKREENLNEEERLCGWGSINPSFCQKFKRPGCLLFWLCTAAFLQGMFLNGLLSVVISSLEKRYNLSSSQSGMIASCYDIMTTISFIPVSYFGGLGYKQRYLSTGTFLIGIAALVFTVPQFATSVYKIGAEDDKLCVVNSSTSFSCDKPSEQLSDFRYVFYLSMLIAGAGSVPFFSLAQPYLDENVPLQSSALYLGIYHMLNVLGPAAGYLLGAVSLGYYVDFYRTDVTVEAENSRYVGAWWISFVVVGIFSIIVAVPLFGFPPALQDVNIVRKEREKEEYSRKGRNEQHGPGVSPSQSKVINSENKHLNLPKKVIKSLKTLIVNPTFVFLTIAETFEGFLFSAASTFLPKYAEILFSLPASSAALYTGLAVLPAGAIGMFLGGYIVKRFQLSVTGVLRLCLGLKCGVTVIGLFLLLRCSNLPFAGVNVDYGAPADTRQNFIGKFQPGICQQNCSCRQENGYMAICGVDKITYFSPCHAGCMDVVKTESPRMFHNCSCINTEGSTSHDAVLGACTESCALFPLFMVLCSLYILINFMLTIPALSAVLRCVPFQERALALGIQATCSRLFGFIPGPIVFGSLIDVSCLLWQTDCEEEGFCYFYDLQKISLFASLFFVGLNVLTCVFIFISWKLYNAKYDKCMDTSLELTISPCVNAIPKKTNSTINMEKAENVSQNTTDKKDHENKDTNSAELVGDEVKPNSNARELDTSLSKLPKLISTVDGNLPQKSEVPDLL